MYKLHKFGEFWNENTEPSLNSNVFEGVETRKGAWKVEFFHENGAYLYFLKNSINLLINCDKIVNFTSVY